MFGGQEFERVHFPCVLCSHGAFLEVLDRAGHNLNAFLFFAHEAFREEFERVR